MKAFLSHSSKDKQFVEAVAKELGRQYCIVDNQAFRTGKEFKDSIVNAFDESSVFVLFASSESMASIWVDFEIEEAWYRKLQTTLKKSLVYIIDSSVNFDDLPEWLSRALVRKENSPKIVARDIRQHLIDIMLEKQNTHFIGRNSNVEEIESKLTPLDGSNPPHAVFVSGLPGIGRRTLVKRASPSILNLHKFVLIRVGESDSVNDLCISVSEHVEPFSTIKGFEKIVSSIRELNDNDALKRTLENLRTLVKSGELPMFFDDGGI